MWGNDKQLDKKIKMQGLGQNINKKGNWGKPDPENINNLGYFGFRGTPEQNAQIGREMGKMKVGR